MRFERTAEREATGNQSNECPRDWDDTTLMEVDPMDYTLLVLVIIILYLLRDSKKSKDEDDTKKGGH